MVATYTILGKQVQSQWIALATLGTALTGALLPSYLPKSESAAKKAPTPAPAAPVAAKEDDLDVEKLLNELLKEEE